MSLYKRYLFFRDHAGYCVGYRAGDALALARAEMWAEACDIEFLWSEDYDDYPNSLGNHGYWCTQESREEYEGTRDRDRHTHEIYWCQASWHGELQASLGAIIDPSQDYQRVVEAELALEAKAKANKFIYY